MGNKTIGEMQDMTLGGFNHTIRKMNKEQQDRYAPQGSPQWEKRQADKLKNEQNAAAFERDLKRWDKDNLVMVGGRMAGLTQEDMAALREKTARNQEDRKAYIAILEKRYPIIFVPM
jgi:hypothetical protein